jgi:hypothetical protein
MLPKTSQYWPSDERKKVDDLAREWQRWAEQQVPEDDQGIFMRFIALWVEFNAVYVSRYDGLAGDTELAKILKIGATLSEFHHMHLSSDREYLSAVQSMNLRPVYNSTTSRNFKIRDRSNVRNVLQYIYNVRNNLFHGRKVPSELHDRALVSNGVVVLDRLLKHLLSSKTGDFRKDATPRVWQP